MLTLGIDVGTTSVKIVLVKKANDEFKVIASKSASHSADIIAPSLPTHSEQDAGKIWFTVQQCMKLIESDAPAELAKVETICMCGQMHGCILWNNSDTTEDHLFSTRSSLVTWRDQRCDVNFLSSLPDPEGSIPISAGYGCASLFWLKRNTPDELSKYNCAGTVMDYFVASLCCSSKPSISTQNAMSWGYFNFNSEEWNTSILENSDFPVKFLPTIAKAGSVAGGLSETWYGIPAGTRVLTALGDMQCSVLSCTPEESDGVFNLGTSAQLSMLLPKASAKAAYSAGSGASTKLPPPAIHVPYFSVHCLQTSASLNGGAVLEMLAMALFQWTKQFAPSVSVGEIYRKLNEESDTFGASKLVINPTVFGERHCPEANGSVCGIGPTPVTLSGFAHELGHSVIKNVADMFKGEKENSLQPKRIWACGSAFRNLLFRKAMQDVFNPAECRFDKELDAAFGAAIVPHLRS